MLHITLFSHSPPSRDPSALPRGLPTTLGQYCRSVAELCLPSFPPSPGWKGHVMSWQVCPSFHPGEALCLRGGGASAPCSFLGLRLNCVSTT